MNPEVLHLKEKLKNLPAAPGVYQFKDAAGKIIYVGKAKNLKNRVRQYFHQYEVANSAPLRSGKTAVMVSKIRDFELITTDTEVEALILEINLIKSLKPRYNVNLKDDKTYPYIVITNEEFPRIFPTRTKRSDGSRYYGPFTDVKNLRYSLKSLRDIFMIRSCSLALNESGIFAGKFKDCLDFHIHKCDAPCINKISKDEYNLMIDSVAKLLNGKTDAIIKELSLKMDGLSENMQFEQAARIRDKIAALKIYSEKQKIVDEDLTDRDIFALAKDDNDACGIILKIRDGKVIGKSHYFVSGVLDKDEADILENVITFYYNQAEFVPEEIFTDSAVNSTELISEWLMKKSGKKPRFIVPKIGVKAKLVNMAKANAKLMLSELKLAKLKKEYTPPSLESLKRDLHLDFIPRNIECIDISHIQGTDTVASLVVFVDGKPKKSQYRKFKIQSVDNTAGTPDDFLSMRETVHRRYKRLIEEGKHLPDLIVIDGGKGQLSSAVSVLKDLNISLTKSKKPSSESLQTFVIGLAKKLEEVFEPGDSVPQIIPKSSSGLRLLQKVRDEAHRFAVTFHRELRSKRTIVSELDEIPGVGEKTRTKIFNHFGSVENLLSLIKSDEKLVKNLLGKIVFKKLHTHFFET